MNTFKKYLRSFSTQLGWLMGFMYYINYASTKNSGQDFYLISISIFIAFFAPYYSKISNKIDENACFYTASVFAGKLARFGMQYLFNIFIFMILVQGNAISKNDLSSIGGVCGISFLISLTSQGIQYLALVFSNRDIGTKNLNITIGITFNIFIGALAAGGFILAQEALKILGIFFSMSGLIYSLYTDLRGKFSPTGGVGLFFGTFNPPHKTHLKIIKKFIRDRNLEKVIIHPTLIPKVHRLALEKGQIRIKECTQGMRVYETTNKADIHVNYFMTGNKFYETEHRVNMLNEMIKEEGLENVIEVWNLPNLYNNKGFYSVISHIKRQFPHKAIHGLHGSDVGGMLVRAIYDESFGIIPYAVRRTDKISATAIRKGAKGMTTKNVENYLTQLQS